jgi:hypothetical protein
LSGLRVFVSYPRGGLAHTWAQRVQRELIDCGAEAWRDETGVEEGDANWYTAIRDALVRADVVVGIVGAESERCRWQEREVLYADRITTPLVAFRIASVGLPFYMAEKQPVELRDPPQGNASLALLVRKLAAHRPTARASSSLPDTSPDAARQREIIWLNDLLHGEFSDRETRYVAVEGRMRRAVEAERALKGLRIPTGMVLKAFGVKPAVVEAEPVPYADILEAYRELPARAGAVRRLAVLGEPGAGKSFSLERLACEYARRALREAARPVPLLVRLGLWTREEPLQHFIETQLGAAGRDFVRLRDAGRLVLLLDAVNEIPPGQRHAKAAQIRQMAEDTRFAAVIVSCRERDFEADFRLPFDRLTLQPLTPWQIHGFLLRTLSVGVSAEEGVERAQACFWRIAGERLEQAWQTWQRKGETFERFLTLDETPDGIHEWPDSRSLLADRRGLLQLAGNPFLLTVMTQLPAIPPNRAQLFAGFLEVLHTREHEARQVRHDEASVPDIEAWRTALAAVAEVLQRADGVAGDDGARTSLPMRDLPPAFTPELQAFSIDASVLQRAGDAVRFTHQLLQESLAADVLLDASGTGWRPASDFWPQDRWWQRSGWEVVAEIAAEACEGDTVAQVKLIDWLAADHPGMALDIWNHAERPALPAKLLARTRAQWGLRLTDTKAEPAPEARAAIGRWLGALDLDHRSGTGLRPDGVPDIDWVLIDDDRPFRYQDAEHLPLPRYEISRYPVTNRQWQAFIDDGGYRKDEWWTGLAKRMEPQASRWSEPTAPRETVSWYEAMAYGRWLSAKLNEKVTLPTEQQWERAARGRNGREYPWDKGFVSGRANINETWGSRGTHNVGRTTAVGLYPEGSTPEGIQDLSGNVWEWCLNEYENPQNIDPMGTARWVLRGGSWGNGTEGCRAAFRDPVGPGFRSFTLGLRVVRRRVPHSEPGSLDHRASDATPFR